MNVLNEITLNYHPKKKDSSTRVCSSVEAHKYFEEIWPDDRGMRERFYILLLNNANRVIGHVELSSGGITGTVVDIRLAFATALKSLSTSIILAHNHPSGNLKPSQADLNLSRKFKEAGKFLDIQVLDHIILDAESLFYSLSDNADF
tara:strand:+ start:107366 stop:107806 length:441 start_codon:yes stop_codon:yes gene_type:complete